MATAYQKKTLRAMSPTTRKVARLIGEQASVSQRFKNLVAQIQSLETDSRALATAKQQPADPQLLAALESLVQSIIELGLEKEDSEFLQEANQAIAQARAKI